MRHAKHMPVGLLVSAVCLAVVAGIVPPASSDEAIAASRAGAGAPAEEPPAAIAQASGPWITEHVSPEYGNVPARNVPRAPAWQPGEPIKEIPRRHLVRTEIEHSPAPRGYGMDPLAELQSRTPVTDGRAFSTPMMNFDGIGYQPLNPPDPVGDVGRDYYIQMTNGSGGALFAMYNKNDGSLAAGPSYLSSLVSPSSVCDTGLGDPIVLYDHLAGRWIMTEFSSTGNALCIYFSTTGDPTGTWYRYSMVKPNFPDYPKYAVWPDAYYVSTNESSGPAVYAYKRAAMLAGGSATSVRFVGPALSGFGFQSYTPADLDGDRTPLPGAPGIFMRHNDDEVHSLGTPNASVDYLEIWQFVVNWATHPAGHSFTQLPSVQTTEFDSTLCGLVSFACFPQPGGTGVLLDALREVIMWRLQYRNFGFYETLVGNFVTDINGLDDGAIRWFELRRQGPGVGNWTLYQEGTYSYSLSYDRWMGSIAMDGGGNILLGFNYVNGTSAYASLGLTGRLSQDPLGVMTFSLPVVSGAGANPSNRYGDYNAMTVDPIDDCTFWFTGEYNPSAQWGTRISTVRLVKCPFELETTVMDEEAEPEGGGRKR